MASSGQADAGRGTFAQDAPAETEQFCGPATCPLVKLGRAFDQASLFNETPEILLVKANAGKGLNHTLQLEQCETGREQLEDHRPVLQLAAEPPQGSGENPAMVQPHRLPHCLYPRSWRRRLFFRLERSAGWRPDSVA
jgi:hypothetical protein